MTFLAQASGRESWLPALLWLLVANMWSKSNRMSSSSAEASLPVRSRSRLRRSTRNMWFSVPPDTIRAPSTVMVSAITLALRTIWAA